MASFRSYVWDPILLVSQMITMQCLFYVSLGLWLYVIDSVMGLEKSIHQILDHVEIADFNNGRPTMLASSLNCLTSAIGLRIIIGRSKQCFDFTSTLYFFHMIITWIYSGIPTHWGWWVLNAMCLALTTVLGEFLCMRAEMSAIPVTFALSNH
ncbi:protein SYS1 homolog [Corticium candelabrum]|uniref:protein SYS1 homolog n=1 Tax=Corticium candelabrum TaxID=121492 RepID=UPI002E264245|nr:protein SYS1 homolog [Corticium candelabrum]